MHLFDQANILVPNKESNGNRKSANEPDKSTFSETSPTKAVGLLLESGSGRGDSKHYTGGYSGQLAQRAGARILKLAYACNTGRNISGCSDS